MDDQEQQEAQSGTTDEESNVKESNEKTFTQADIDRIVKREKAAVAERLRREMEQNQTQQQQQQSMGGMQSPIDVDSIKQELLKELQSQQEAQMLKAQEEELHRELKKVGDLYHQRIDAGKDKYSDFNDVMLNFKPETMPRTAFLATEFPETLDIVYELGKNPEKALYIEQLAERDPDLAMNAISKIRDSIVQNQEALESEPQTPEPLTRPQSSSIAGTDTGKLGVADFKAMDWLRG